MNEKRKKAQKQATEISNIIKSTFLAIGIPDLVVSSPESVTALFIVYGMLSLHVMLEPGEVAELLTWWLACCFARDIYSKHWVRSSSRPGDDYFGRLLNLSVANPEESRGIVTRPLPQLSRLGEFSKSWKDHGGSLYPSFARAINRIFRKTRIVELICDRKFWNNATFPKAFFRLQPMHIKLRLL